MITEGVSIKAGFKTLNCLTHPIKIIFIMYTVARKHIAKKKRDKMGLRGGM
jgi:hypothetical protein